MSKYDIVPEIFAVFDSNREYRAAVIKLASELGKDVSHVTPAQFRRGPHWGTPEDFVKDLGR